MFSSNACHKAVIEKLASRGSYATVCVSLILRMPPAASPGVYGRQGIPASANTPSSRQNSLAGMTRQETFGSLAAVVWTRPGRLAY
jgi:hypothetical protein